MTSETADEWKLPWEARCRCRRVGLRVTAPPLLTLACHCEGCQRMTASAFSLSIAVPAPAFTVVEGTPELGGLHGASRHYHCPWCKSWMFTRPEGLDELVNVRASLLDVPGLHEWFQPWVETHTAEAFPWAKTGAKHSFAKLPEAGAWAPMIAEFAAQAPRPTGPRSNEERAP
jgi:hypothetical protein